MLGEACHCILGLAHDTASGDSFETAELVVRVPFGHLVAAVGRTVDPAANLDEAPLDDRHAGNPELGRSRWAVQLGYRRQQGIAAYAELGPGRTSSNWCISFEERGYHRIVVFQDRHDVSAQADGEACAVESDHAVSGHHVVFDMFQSGPFGRGMAVDLALSNVEEIPTASEQVRKHRPCPFPSFPWKLPILVGS